jgi:hypothetical protein
VIAGGTVTSGLSVLREIPVPIVICDCETTSGTWRWMLRHISRFPAPLLIVTPRLADERFSPEAPKLGAWDVLAKPGSGNSWRAS